MGYPKIKVRIPPLNEEIEGEEIPISTTSEQWCEYRLEDKSVLRIKPGVFSFIRIPGRFDPDGNPIYVVRGGMITAVAYSPPELQKKAQS
jgi:hypothetical protein